MRAVARVRPRHAACEPVAHCEERRGEACLPLPVADPCDPGMQGACAGTRYVEVVEGLGGFVDTICQPTFEHAFAAIARHAGAVEVPPPPCP